MVEQFFTMHQADKQLKTKMHSNLYKPLYIDTTSEYIKHILSYQFFSLA